MKTARQGLVVALLTVAPMMLPETATAEMPVGVDTVERPALEWSSDYFEAHARAKESEKLLLIYFFNANDEGIRKQFEAQTLTDDQVRSVAEDYVRVKLPTSVEIEQNGTKQRLLSHPAFAHMSGRQGLTVVDLKNKSRSYYGKPVGCLPFVSAGYYAPEFSSKKAVREFLMLPEGTLSQRMLTFAVRCHPEQPASATGRCDSNLMSACSRHSHHQASIQNQGHHNWESRFHEIHHIVGGRSPVEVCAESWPGENLIQSCFSCVYAWRQSSGHWNAVNGQQPAFGYDIKRGANGIWYATGIFGGWHAPSS